MNLKELAQTLGLSQTTVSRALNGYEDVAAKTRERVAKAAKEHNYRPNRRARALATGRSRRVAIVTGAGDRRGLNDPIFCAFLSGATDALERQNFDWIIRQSNASPGESQIAQLLNDDSLEGAILTAPSRKDLFFAETAKSTFPVVVRGRFYGRASTVSGVDFDHRLAMQSAITSLIECGHRHIALIAGERDCFLKQAQTTAYLSAMETSGLQASPGLMHFGPHTQQFGISAVDALSQRNPSPTALVIGCSIIAAGVSAGLVRLKSDAKNDMRYLFYDEGLFWLNAGTCADHFASLSTPAAMLGQEAARRLIQQISAPDTVPDVRLLAPSLVLNEALVSKKRSSQATTRCAESSRQAILP